MSKYKWFWIIIVCAVSFGKTTKEINASIDTNLSAQSQLETNTSKNEKRLERIYKNALHDFQVGSYYQALDEFSYLAKFPKTPYFLPSLYMLAYTYLYIGKRVGNKKYLWDAINYLNVYVAYGGKRDAKYYYLKGLIYESLGFYERAFTNFKLALKQSSPKSLQLDIVMGLLRTSVWLKNLSAADRYLMILSVESLNKRQKKEFTFLQGMYEFVNKRYKKALTYFKKTYRDYENYLIENPHYYLLIAETAYRVGELQLSETLLRRILNYVKNKNVLPRALMRLGDIKFLQKDYQASAHYFIRIIKNFPQTQYAKVAKLKILYIIKKDKKISHYVKKYLDAPFLQDPMQYIVQTLVKNRRNYVGLFALANFGLEVFALQSDKLNKRLIWELSVIDSKALKYEHKEYFRRLWSPFLQDPTLSQLICPMYKANASFFQEVFQKDLLVKVAHYLQSCKMLSQSVALLQFLATKYNDDAMYYHIVSLYMKQKEYSKALNIMQHITERDCRFMKTKASICFLGNFSCTEDTFSKVGKVCPPDFETAIFKHILLVQKGVVQTDFVKQFSSQIVQHYSQPLVRAFVQMLVQKLLQQERYEDVIDIVSPIAAKYPKDCFLNSILALAYAREDKVTLARDLLQKVSHCQDSWYNLATIVVEDKELERKLQKVE